MFRQGDLLIRKIKNVPEKTVKKADNIVLEGEATGHMHRLIGGDILLADSRMFLQVPDRATIIHDEHFPIPLEKGDYEVIRQKEYKSENMTQVVVD